MCNWWVMTRGQACKTANTIKIMNVSITHKSLLLPLNDPYLFPFSYCSLCGYQSDFVNID